MRRLPDDGYPPVKEGDIIFTKECRACWDAGMCGETITQKTTYKVTNIEGRLMAVCQDYDVIRELKSLMSTGQYWYRKGYSINS